MEDNGYVESFFVKNGTIHAFLNTRKSSQENVIYRAINIATGEYNDIKLLSNPVDRIIVGANETAVRVANDGTVYVAGSTGSIISGSYRYSSHLWTLAPGASAFQDHVYHYVSTGANDLSSMASDIDMDADGNVYVLQKNNHTFHNGTVLLADIYHNDSFVVRKYALVIHLGVSL